MRTLIGNTSGLLMHFPWLASFAAVGLGAVVWISSNRSDPAAASSSGATAARTADRLPAVAPVEGSTPHTLDDAIEFARVRRAAIDGLKDYSATFSKTESVNQRLVHEKMSVKIRHEPFSVYLQSHSARQPCREVIFVAGSNDDRMTLHESGFKAFITLNLSPDDPRVMAENHYPITEIGMAKLLDTALAVWEREKHIAPANVEVLISDFGAIGTTECEQIQITHKLRITGLLFHQTRLWFEKHTGFPIQVEQYDWPKKPGDEALLVEQYTYSDIQANAGMRDVDFDPANAEYSFRKSGSRTK